MALLLCAPAQAAEANDMRTVVKGSFSGIQEECRLVVTNQAGWDAVWKRHTVKKTPKEPAPEVNFEKETVLAAAQGQQRTGGFSIEIAGVEQQGEKTIVTVRERKPKPGGITIQALTAPIHIVAVPKISGEVEFKSGK